MNRLFRNNLTAKVLAIILAVVLWLYVMNEQNPPLEASYTLPLEVQNLAEGYQVIDAPETVRLKIRGPRSIMAGVTQQDLHAYVDLKGLAEGRHSLKVATVVPGSLEIVEVNPDKVMLHVDKSTSRTYSIEVRTIGTPQAGSTVGKLQLKTNSVAIAGPKSLLESIERVVVQVDVSNKQGQGTVNLPVLVLNREGKIIEGLEVQPEKVALDYAMTVVGAKKTVEVRPVLAGELGMGLVIRQLLVEPDKVEISGNQAVLDKIGEIQTEPIVITGINKDTSFEAKLVLKEGVTTAVSHVTVRINFGSKGQGTE